MHFLIEKNIGSKEEQEFFKFLIKIAGRPHGEKVGINCSDEHFKHLTIAATSLRYKKGKISQVFDVRFPTCTTPDKIIKQISKEIPKNAKIKLIKAFGPFIVNPKSKVINALSKAYTEATGEESKLFTMGGATYARCFKCATSFGPLRS